MNEEGKNAKNSLDYPLDMGWHLCVSFLLDIDHRCPVQRELTAFDHGI